MTDSDEVKLLPCPFCGGAAKRVGSSQFIRCSKCQAEAIQRFWNTRPPVVTDEVVERVAIAMTAKRVELLNMRLGMDASPGWDDYTDEGKDDARNEARAALASMPAVVSGGQSDE